MKARRDKMLEASKKETLLAKKDADKNEIEKRKREEEKKERKQREADKTVLVKRKDTAKKATGPTKQTKKKSKESAAGKKLKEKAELWKRKEEEDKVKVEARREELITEGVTPIVLGDDKSEGSDDMDWESDQWEVVDHAVDWNTAKANYKVVTGMRAGENGAEQMWVMWGQRSACCWMVWTSQRWMHTSKTSASIRSTVNI